ncbi:putative 60S ribosomal protein L14 [Blattamonas nauphoetae]|uniref:60S ribosomal protein L14 n=1 Tax=Blattamonas nauphoetae TaxID=2049346 RepID=A0ABQ9YHG8_9EUKA|nr:putative 60S ribosomal protein L14 [Blattamonas nauphoetae]
MPQRFVEIGRVCLVNYGKINKLCVIVDVVDHNKVLVDGPEPLTGIKRQVISLRRLSLTPFTVNISHGAHQQVVVKAFEKAQIQKRFNRTSWGKKMLKRELRLVQTDFDRFVEMKKKREVNHGVKGEAALVKSASK